VGAALAAAGRAEQARGVLGGLSTAPATTVKLARLWLLHVDRPASAAAAAAPSAAR
jgi:hypothetical protein